MNRYLIALLAILATSLCLLVWERGRIISERDRFRDNQSALLSQAETYRTESGKSAASVKALTLEAEELREGKFLAEKAVEELRLKLKRVQSLSSAVTETRTEAQTVLRDTIILRDSIVTPAKAFMWRDAWTRIEGVIDGPRVNLSIRSSDTITQVVHREPHKFWFIKWGTKAIRQEMVSSNPHTMIVYSEYIKLK